MMQPDGLDSPRHDWRLLPDDLVGDLVAQWVSLGRLAEAAAVLRELAERLPSSPRLLQAAVRLAHRQDDEAALGTALEALAAIAAPQDYDDDVLLIAAAHAGGRAAALLVLRAGGPERAANVLEQWGRLALVSRQVPEAVEVLRAALAKAPASDVPRIGILFATALRWAGENAEATTLFARHLPNVPPRKLLYMRAAETALAGGNSDIAWFWITLAQYNRMLGPRPLLARAEASIARGNSGQALKDLNLVLAKVPRDVRLNLRIARLSVAAGHPGLALGAVNVALEAKPDDPECQVLKARLLIKLDAVDAAQELLERLHGQLPADPDVLTALAEVRLLQGHSTHALELLKRVQSSGAVGEHVEQLEQRLNVGQSGAIPVVAERPVPDMFKPQWTEAEVHGRLSGTVAARNAGRVITALVLREVRTRFGRNKAGYLWALADPAVQVAVFMLIFSAFNGSRDYFGMSLPLFLVTGIVPFLMFQQTFGRINGCIIANRPLLSHPHVKPMDIVFARAILEFVSVLCVMIIFLVILGMTGDDVTPSNLPRSFAGLALLWGAGLGLGLIVEAFYPVMRTLGTLVNAVVRILYFTSGALFTLPMLPQEVADILLLNPLLHAIEIIRQSFTPLLHTQGINLVYPAFIVGGMLLFGLLANRAMEKRLLED